MSKPRITIVGTGFIGGSIGLALHKTEADFEIVGHDREHGVARKAQKIGAPARLQTRQVCRDLSGLWSWRHVSQKSRTDPSGLPCPGPCRYNPL